MERTSLRSDPRKPADRSREMRIICVESLETRNASCGLASPRCGTVSYDRDPSSVITTISDVVDSTDGLISLRETSYAGAGGIVTFNASLNGKTITMVNGQVTIGSNEAIDASSLSRESSSIGIPHVFSVTMLY